MSLTHHVPLHPSTENAWDEKLPPALEEHSQDKVSLLSSTGFWKFLATNTIPGTSSRFGGGVVCVCVSAESSSKPR